MSRLHQDVSAVVSATITTTLHDAQQDEQEEGEVEIEEITRISYGDDPDLTDPVHEPEPLKQQLTLAMVDDLDRRLAFGSKEGNLQNGMDMSLLMGKCLHPKDQVQEEDVYWDWDRLLDEVAAAIRDRTSDEQHLLRVS